MTGPPGGRREKHIMKGKKKKFDIRRKLKRSHFKSFKRR